MWNQVRVSTGGTCEAASMLVPLGNCAAFAERRELFGVPLLDHAEATELALVAVEVAVVVGVAGDEAVAADAVVGLDPLDHMDRERQPGDPGLAGGLSAR